jgi:hypothetical protein
MMRKILLFAAIAGALTAPLSSVQAQRKECNAEQITATQLRDYLTFVASDEMEGRNTPSRGLDTVAKFIAMMLSRWGAKPGGDDGTYFQHIALRRDIPDTDKTRLEIAGHTFTYGDDYFAAGSGDVTVNAPLVYVGDGWLIKSKNIDDYQGIDAKGKIVVANYGNGFTPPHGLLRSDLTGKPDEDWANAPNYARQKGAAALIFVVPESMQSDVQQMRRQAGQSRLFPEKFRFGGTPTADMPVFYIMPKVAETLFQGEKMEAAALQKSSADKTPVPAFAFSADKKVTLTAATKVERVMTQNVVGIFEGRDPLLKNEYVAFGAHYDHLGIATRPINGDSIYNGADDDGSGTVSLISMAEALGKAKRRPKRSTLFVWHCGEEKGLWGSQYFTSYPTIPLDHIVTQLNIDMIGRSKSAGDTNPANKELSGPDEVYVIGSKMMSTELGTLSEKVNTHYLKLNFNYRYDDPKDPNRFFFRSDHFNYAQKGIPIIFYFDGVHEDYHRVTDEVQKIDFNKMEKVARTVYETMWEVSELKSRPVIDKKLPAELTR